MIFKICKRLKVEGTHSIIAMKKWHCRYSSCICCCCCVASVVSDSVRPHRRQPTRPPIPGILQARTLEWVAISFSNAWKWKVKVKSLNRVRLLATPWTAAYQSPLSMGFSRQEYWSGLPLPSPIFLPRKFYRQRSLAGYSPRGHKESEMTERLTFHFMLIWPA